MNMVKALLVGSAAALTGFAANAADLPRKSAPAEFVRVCNGFGAGFYMIPGSTTCIQIGGFIRSEIFMGTQGASTTGYALGTVPGQLGASVAAPSAVFGANNFQMGSRFFLHADARTQTSMGVVRSYGRYFATNGVSNYPGSNGAAYAAGQPGGGVNLLEAFIQFSGITTGFAMSNFSYYNGDWNFQDVNGEHDYRAAQLAYTASLGNGITATVALEDRNSRNYTAQNSATASTVLAASVVDAAAVYGANKMPDLVANVNVTQAWGTAQVMGAYSDIRNNVGASKGGYAIGGGVRINAGMPGSQFLLQAGYANGAINYVTKASIIGLVGNGPAQVAPTFGIYSDVTGGMNLTKAWSVLGGYNAVWSPSFRTSLLVSYQNIDLPSLSAASTALVADQKSLNVALTANYTMAPGFTLGAELFYDKTNYGFSTGSAALNAANPSVVTSTNALGLNLRVQRAF